MYLNIFDFNKKRKNPYKKQDFIKIKDNLIIKKKLIKCVKTYAEETEYCIDIYYNDTYETITFKKQDDMRKEYYNIIKQLEE